MTPRVAIIDSGGANIASLDIAMQRLGARCTLTRNAQTIRDATHVILPGVGAAADAMLRLQDNKLGDTIRKLTQPVLGICLGMQLLTQWSEEDGVKCLGILPGTVRKLPGSAQNPVPNMGWCRVTRRAQHPLLVGIDDGSYFYFIHSYALPVMDYTLATATHSEPLTAIAVHNNFVATQFHPERSAGPGARFLKNFLQLRV